MGFLVVPSLWDLSIVVSDGGTASMSPGIQEIKVGSEPTLCVSCFLWTLFMLNERIFESLNYAKGNQLC